MTTYRKIETESGTVFLTFDEVRILLHSQGFHSCEGIYMPEKIFSSQEVLSVIYSLSKRGILQVMEEKEREAPGSAVEAEVLSERKREGSAAKVDMFHIRQDILQMILIMGAPVETLIYRQGESLPGFRKEFHNGREYFCYIVPNQILVVDQDWTRTDMLRMRIMSPEVFSRWEKEREKETAEDENRVEETPLSETDYLTTIF